MSENPLFKKLVGKWSGPSRTWFEPEKLADESAVSGEFSLLMNGQFLRHLYNGSMQGQPRHGEELIARNSITGDYQVAWIDSFHMNYAILFSTGKETDDGFAVRGDYDVGADHPKWGWRTEYHLVDGDHLTIVAYNIMPQEAEAKAVEIQYKRVDSR